MLYCPNCGNELAADAAECVKCQAVFSGSATWAPVDKPPKAAARPPESWGDVAATVILRLFVICIAAVPLALISFAAMFAAFSGSSSGFFYFAVAALAGGLFWVFHPIYAFATRAKKGQR